MRVFAAHQPNLLPYGGWWQKARAADVFGLMPAAQYSRGDWHNRCLVGRDAAPRWFTIPVAHRLGQRIDEALVAEDYDPRSALGTLDAVYRGAPGWTALRAWLTPLVEGARPGGRLTAMTLPAIERLREALGVQTEFVTLPAALPGETASEALARWTAEHGCTEYLSGRGGHDYLDEGPFAARGIAVHYHEPSLPEGLTRVSVLTALAEGIAL